MNIQCILPLLPSQGASSELIIGESNRLAMHTVLAPWNSPVLFLHGEAGCGKSLLAHRWAHEHSALWLHQSLDDGQLERLSTGYFILDNLELNSGGGVDISDISTSDAHYHKQLFHLLNIIKETSSQLLLCSRLSPATFPVTLPDLSSRLRAMKVAHILPPDDAMMHALLIQQCAEKQLRIDTGVVHYLLPRLPRSFADIIHIVALLDTLSLEKQRGITLPLARQALEGL